jgi:hypothetical protein
MFGATDLAFSDLWIAIVGIGVMRACQRIAVTPETGPSFSLGLGLFFAAQTNS